MLFQIPGKGWHLLQAHTQVLWSEWIVPKCRKVLLESNWASMGIMSSRRH